MILSLSWLVIIGIVLIALSAFPAFKLNQKGVSLWNLGWAFVLTGVFVRV